MTPPRNLEFDHLVAAVADLPTGARELHERTGLAAVPGGRHPGHGTHNAIVPLGPDYVELVAIESPAEAETSAFGRAVAARVATGGGLFAICLRTGGIESVAERLGLETASMERETPDGTTLTWKLAGLAEALHRRLPFFIEWSVEPDRHPGRAAADHRVTPTGIAWVEVPVDASSLARWVGASKLDLRPVGPDAPMRAAIDTAVGPIGI